jgi:biotin operon repressor
MPKVKIDKQKLCELLNAGICNQAELARELGVSRQQIHQMLVEPRREKLGGKIQRKRGEIFLMWLDGHTVKEIAEELGFSYTGTYQVLVKLRKKLLEKHSNDKL